MTAEDTCISREDLDAVREIMQHQIESVEELINTKIAGLKEIVDKNEQESGANHEHLEELIRLAKQEGQREREKIEADLRTLREGRSTDKGRALGQEPWIKLALTVVAAILTAALIAFFAGRGSNAPQPAPAGSHP